MRDFRKQGKRTICYLSAGTLETWRPDAGRFPEEVVGKAMEEWDEELWLDVRRPDVLLPIMATRMDECAEKGFDAVEPDNVDGYGNDTGYPLLAEDQRRHNRTVAQLAHERGLAVALKNDVDQIAELDPDFAFAINEECFAYDECEAYEPFTTAGKVVFDVESEDVRDSCERAQELGITSMRKHMDLGAGRQDCRMSSREPETNRCAWTIVPGPKDPVVPPGHRAESCARGPARRSGSDVRCGTGIPVRPAEHPAAARCRQRFHRHGR